MMSMPSDRAAPSRSATRSRRELRDVHPPARACCWSRWSALVVAGSIAFTITDGVSMAYAFVWTLDTVTTLGSIQDPHATCWARGRRPARDVRHRYALLRAGDGGGVLRLRPARAACSSERRTQRMIDSYYRPLHRLRLRSRRPPGGPRPPGGGGAARRDRRRAGQPRDGRVAGRALHRELRRRRRGAARGRHRAGARGDRLRGLRRRQHLHRAHRARAARPTSSSSPAPRPRTPRRSCCAPAPTA